MKAVSLQMVTIASLMSCVPSSKNCGTFLLELEAREKERTGINSLKVEYNRVHGFYIEISNAQSAAKVPDDYRRRQTLKNAERYVNARIEDI